MFKLYAEGARRSIFFARYEADRLGSPSIEPGHLLPGLMRKTGFRDEAIRAEIEKGPPRTSAPTSRVDLPLAESVKRALAFAAEESERANHPHIGVEDLLLGLLRESDSIVALLQKHGIDRAAILRNRPKETPEPAPARDSLRGWGASGGRGGSWHTNEAGRIKRGRYSCSRMEDGETLSCAQGISGPGQSKEYKIDFDVRGI